MNPLKVISDVHENSLVKNLTSFVFSITFAVAERRETIEEISLIKLYVKSPARIAGANSFIFFMPGAEIPLACVTVEEIAISEETIEERIGWLKNIRIL